MALKLKVFSKKAQEENIAIADTLKVVEPALYSIADAQEAFYRYIFPKNTERPLTAQQKLAIELVKNSLQKSEVRQKAVPRLPSIIPKLLRSLRDPNSAAKDYVEIINKDPVMSAAVLKRANSAYFSPSGAHIGDIEPAVVKLGIDGLRTVLSAAVMQPIIQKDSAHFSHAGQKLWQHSLKCATACQLISEHRKMENFKPYILGLVHDIGKSTVYSELCKQFKSNGGEVSPGYNAFVPLMSALAPAVSYWVAKDWELPIEVYSALAEQVNIKAGREVSPYAFVLYQANLACEAHATIYKKNKRLAEYILSELKLPENLYEKIDELRTEV